MSRYDEPQKRRVYFVQSGPGGPIKIGRSGNVRSRVNEMQTGNPLEIRILAALAPSLRSLDEERGLHERFNHLRIAREWFRPAPELISFIAASQGLRA